MFSDKESFKKAYLEKLQQLHGKGIEETTAFDQYVTLATMVRDYVSKNWVKTNKAYQQKAVKQVYYFSIEFLFGRVLHTNLINSGLADICHEALTELGIDLNQIEEEENDAGLGSGGLGRLAACFLDSLASRHLPGHGCGIRYKYGLFQQQVINGYQVELPDQWLKNGNAWEVRKADKAVEVKFGGNVQTEFRDGRLYVSYENYDPVLAVPYDVPIVGFNNNTVNTLRLWSAETIKTEFDFSTFNRGDYLKAVEYRYAVESISEILYPEDSHYQGQVLRLKQQYFFVSAGVQSIIRHFKKKQGCLSDFAEHIAIHINDTHPALVIPELMRILMDEEGLGWEEAWRITTNTVSYTNHTIMPEALEKWPVEVIKTLLPRIYMIVEEINERFCRGLWQQYPGEWDKISVMAIISNGFVHMANLAVVGSYSVNGVAKIHTAILKKQVMKQFHEYYPYKFNNKTNGITHRRWLLKANPLLADLITDTLGPSWIYHPADLLQLQRFANDICFQADIAAIKYNNKKRLAEYIYKKQGITVDAGAIFDIQVKRIHAYKRQLLNTFHIMDLYNRLKENPAMEMMPRVFIFAGKAAPSYHFAKLTIKLINTLADVINNDKSIQDKIKVVFLENYSVSLAEIIIPAADVSEQISTASKEASGTGNMKLMLNGAVTVGTLDGANIEIRDEVGEDNFISFGLTADEVLNYYQHGGYSSWQVYNNDARLQTILEQLVNGFLPLGKEELLEIYERLMQQNDEFFVLKDFSSYVAVQDKVNNLYCNKEKWVKMCIANIAHAGKFSSDKTIKEYAIGIWKTKPVIISEVR